MEFSLKLVAYLALTSYFVGFSFCISIEDRLEVAPQQVQDKFIDSDQVDSTKYETNEEADWSYSHDVPGTMTSEHEDLTENRDNSYARSYNSEYDDYTDTSIFDYLNKETSALVSLLDNITNIELDDYANLFPETNEYKSDDALDDSKTVTSDEEENDSLGETDSETTDKKQNDSLGETDSKTTDKKQNDSLGETDSETTDKEQNDSVDNTDSETTDKVLTDLDTGYTVKPAKDRQYGDYEYNSNYETDYGAYDEDLYDYGNTYDTGSYDNYDYYGETDNYNYDGETDSYNYNYDGDTDSYSYDIEDYGSNDYY